MVLRGSAVHPEKSLTETKQEIQDVEEKLEELSQEIEVARHQRWHNLAELEKKTNPTVRDVISVLSDIQVKIETLEAKQAEAENLVNKNKEDVVNTLKQLLCGGLAGAIARTTVAPIDRVKILQQTQHLTQKGNTTKYAGILQTLQVILKEEGVAKLWRGNGTNCFRVIPYAATQFTSYEKYKVALLPEGAEELTVPRRLAAGALAGMTATTLTHPLDVTRLRLAVQPELKGPGDAFKSILAENGIKSLYKGYTPTLLSLAPFIGLNFAAFDTLKSHFGRKDGSRPPVAQTLALGATAGLFAQTICYPLDTVRRRMQLAGNSYTGIVNAFGTIARVEGYQGFYKGFRANALKVVPNNGVRFLAYETLKRVLGAPEKKRRR